MSPRFGELPGLDNHLTPEDEDERTDEEIQEDLDHAEDAALRRAEDRETDGDWDWP